MASKYVDEQHQRMFKNFGHQEYAINTKPTPQQSEVQAIPPSAQYATQWPRSDRPQQNKQQTPNFDGTKITNSHILFWHGPLSNWSTNALFSGKTALDLLLPRLVADRINHPSEQALSTRLLARHQFNCGEQFMMACKGWLFERDQIMEAQSQRFTDEAMEGLCRTVMGQPQPPSPSPSPAPPQDTKTSPRAESRSRSRSRSATRDTSPRAKSGSRSRSRSPSREPTPQKLSREPRVPAEHLAAIRKSTLVQVLQTSEPKYQKLLGRQSRNFDDRVWKPASKHVVVSACIARAENDNELRRLYNLAGNAVPQTQQQQNTNTNTNTQTRPGSPGRGRKRKSLDLTNNTAATTTTGSPGRGKKRASPDRDTTTDTTQNNDTTAQPPAKRIRTFVEGSPVDRIWGVGLNWKDAACDNERNWRGENRLGKCHDEAAKYVRENRIGVKMK
ncbi:hypothetical protein H2200_005148 [Cladophialophora chaetospira]|uniref:NADAR domain-containing protein n=1 Tax=Cladophialophora chaetospira TaxID=386627 RepID=A0AA38XBM2_9EURO|nr:hypothetical protein H2200_005148 [Cladophialophora chaetospira]